MPGQLLRVLDAESRALRGRCPTAVCVCGEVYLTHLRSNPRRARRSAGTWTRCVASPSRRCCCAAAGGRSLPQGRIWTSQLPSNRLAAPMSRWTEFAAGPYSDFSAGVPEDTLERWCAPWKDINAPTWESGSAEERDAGRICCKLSCLADALSCSRSGSTGRTTCTRLGWSPRAISGRPGLSRLISGHLGVGAASHVGGAARV